MRYSFKTYLRRWRLSNAMDTRSVRQPVARRTRAGRDSFLNVHSALSDSGHLPWADPGRAIGQRAVRTIARRGVRQRSYLGFGHAVAACMALAGCLTAWNAYDTHFRVPNAPVAVTAASDTNLMVVDVPLAQQARLLREDTRTAAEIMTSRIPMGVPEVDEPR
ncbi:MAG: hypothetical protein HUU18_03935 [Phycisphaerales bacterium]|nr:hypothetical protein [Phycisphaerales bacterium]